MLAATQPRMKSPEAFRTISEVSDELDVPQHVLRFWESRFAHVRPVKRAGGRRYYRPEDIDLLRGIRSLLYSDGYTIKGVQKILRDRGLRHVAEIGRGEAKAAAPIVRAVETEAPEIEAFEIAELAVDETVDDTAAETAEPTFARAQIALLERAHAEPEAMVEEAAVVEEPVVVEELIALEEVVVEEPVVVEPAVLEEMAVAEEPSLGGEQRVQLEFLLAELLSLKKRLVTARG